MPEKILYAEDEPTQRRILEMFLLRNFPNYKVESFSNGTDLHKRISNGLEDVATIITDNEMDGGYNGLTVIEINGRRLQAMGIPCFMFYDGDKEIGERAMRYGATGYVPKTNLEKKPNHAELISRIRESLNSKKPISSSQ